MTVNAKKNAAANPEIVRPAQCNRSIRSTERTTPRRQDTNARASSKQIRKTLLVEMWSPRTRGIVISSGAVTRVGILISAIGLDSDVKRQCHALQSCTLKVANQIG